MPAAPLSGPSSDLTAIAPGAQDARILLAEDHPVNQELVRVQLAMRGYSCEVVGDGEAALAALETGEYHLLLVDCHMPLMDGYEVAREVRRREAGSQRHLPIVAMTADARADQREICLAAGMDDLLHKPIRLEAFHDTVARWLHTEPVAWPDIDMTRMRRAFGSDANVASVIRAGIEATHEALVRFDGVMERADGDEVAGWIHHVLGGVNVFGVSVVAQDGEQLERALREGGVLDGEAVRRFARDVQQFTEGLEAFVRAKDQ
jgi:two-component system sensor histidine kinase EvgS